MAYTTIDKPSDYFETKLWSGNATDDRAISGLDFAPNWVWIKNRTDTNSHALFDTVRGATKYIESDTSDAEATGATFLKSFTSDGFTLGTAGRVNANSQNYVSWNWKKVAGVFDIQTYSGASNTRTISHNLGSVPKAMIFKRFDDGAWIVYHVDAGGANKYLVLNTTAAVDTATTLFNNTVPTSSVFSVGNTNSTNGSGIDYVVYLFGNKQGVSKCGSYTGNGNADGTFVYTGFLPAFVMIKKSSAAENWGIYDTKRNVNGTTNTLPLQADNNGAEADNTGKNLDILSNGIKIKTANGELNTSGGTYIYMAFAENPFITSTGVPATAR
jgi:hypothetical protein